MEKTTNVDGDLFEENQTAILDYIYMEHHSNLHPFHHNYIDKSQIHGQLQNISQYEQRILLPCDEKPEKLISAKEQVTYRHNHQSEAEGYHSEKIRNSIKKDLKETVGSVRRPLTDFNRRESFSKTESPFHVPNSQSEKTLHTCEICNKTFSQNKILIRHMRVHSDVKPFACEICGASFKLEYTLSCHNRMHTGEKPYSCQKCGKKFAQISNMRTHASKYHNDE